MTIEIGIELTCQNPDCQCKTFRWKPISTIHPKFCPRCSSVMEFIKSKARIEKNRNILSQATGYGKNKESKSKLYKNTSLDKRRQNGHENAPKPIAPKKTYNIEGKLDNEWSVAIKILHGYKCAVCGTKKALNSHHIYSRANKSIRWDTDNGICLCVGHHIGSSFSAHKTPVDFTGWLIKNKGQQFMDTLYLKSKTVQKRDYFEKELILKELRKIVLNPKHEFNENPTNTSRQLQP